MADLEGGVSIGAQVLSWQPDSLPFVLASRPRWLKVLDPNIGALGVVKRELPNCRIDEQMFGLLNAIYRTLYNDVGLAHSAYWHR